MITIEEVKPRVKKCIVDALELDLDPAVLTDDTSLFDQADDGGLEMDSLATLEVVVAVCREFDLVATEMDPEVFQTVSTLSEYVVRELEAAAAG